MNINKDLNRDSSTKDLLKFATEHGYHDNEGMDNSPSWMSQELDERVFAESKSCHPVLVKGEIPMTYTEKIDEMVRDFCSVAPKSKSEVRQRISESIHQAIAEERERVVELIKSRKPNEYAVRQYKTMEARTWDEKNLVIEALDDLLASLDKPLIDKKDI